MILLTFVFIAVFIGLFVWITSKAVSAFSNVLFRLNGTASSGDFVYMTLKTTEALFPAVTDIEIENLTYPIRNSTIAVTNATVDGYGIYTSKKAKWLLCASNNAGILWILQIPGIGLFAGSDKLGESGTAKGIIASVEELPFNPSTLAGKIFTFISFSPATALVAEKGFQIGWAKFTAKTDGVDVASRSFLTTMPTTEASAFVVADAFDILNSDVNVNDNTIVTIRNNPLNAQDGATGFLSPFGFILDYSPKTLNNVTFNPGNLVGFPEADLAPFDSYFIDQYALVVFGYPKSQWDYGNRLQAGTGDAAVIYRGLVTVSAGGIGNSNGCSLDDVRIELAQNVFSSVANTTSGEYLRFGSSAIATSLATNDNGFGTNKLKGTFVCLENATAKDTSTVTFNKSGNSKAIMLTYAKRDTNDLSPSQDYTLYYAYGVALT